MTDKEFKNLLDSSLSYKELEEDMKDKILHSEGKDRDFYIEVFEEELTLADKAYSEMNQEIEVIIKDSKVKVVKERKEKENKEREQDLNEAETLLKNL